MLILLAWTKRNVADCSNPKVDTFRSRRYGRRNKDVAEIIVRWSRLGLSSWSGGRIVQPSDAELDDNHDNRTVDETALFEHATVLFYVLQL